jgi:hypothetical protein
VDNRRLNASEDEDAMAAITATPASFIVETTVPNNEEF